MTDKEFDVLDELYFVTSFTDLLGSTGMQEQELQKCLVGLFEKEWIKCFKTVSEEESRQQTDLQHKYRDYYYLASKKGLLAHNQT